MLDAGEGYTGTAYARCSCRDGRVAPADRVTGRLCMGLVYAVWAVAALLAAGLVLSIVS